MKIMLVFPPILGEERYGKLAGAGSYLPPLGLLYLAAVVRDKHEVKIIDGGVLDITVDDVVEEVRRWKPGMVGVTAFTPTVYRASAICKAVKEFDKGIITVMGGPHPSALPEESMKDASVDVVVVGEGERILKELVEALEKGGDLSAVRGILYRKDGKVVSNPLQERIPQLDELPFPARDMVDMGVYRPSVLHYKNFPAFSVMCGRGCPHRCTFCSCAKVFRGRVTMRSPENVIGEIKFLIDKYGAREIMVWDDTFGIFKDWTVKFCDMIKPLNVTWSAWMRADLADPDILKKMAGSGCWHISYGVESGNQKVLDTIKKGFTVEQVRKAFKWTHEAGMEARGTFILGLPNETWDTMMDTINIAIEIKADYAQFQLLTPYPGTELWDTINQYGEFTTNDLSKYTIWFPVFVPKGLTKERLEQAHKLAYRKFYFRAGYIWQNLSKIRSWDDIKRDFIGLSALFKFNRD
ncbi:hypothetical protein AUJ67_08715 [Candidatus Desantisbacteria bacterium CG1_02_49_89]|nr:MAG: hypothetical protein AUJ67_08715 [Candidatus Desantisbacteria bacterium CG1_02_49_89]